MPRRGLACRGSGLRWWCDGVVCDERYLSGHNPPARVSLPFLPDLHAEVEKEWKKLFSSRIHWFH